MQRYLKDILLSFTDNYKFIGGHEYSERKVLVLRQIYNSPFQILYIEDIGPDIRHGDVLGSLISIGINRDKIGDIVFNGSRVEFAVIKDSINNVISSLRQIKNQPVSCHIKESYQLQDSDTVDHKYRASVASLRLDCIIAEMAKTSRSKGQDLIKQGKVKLNHIEEKKNDIPISEGDIISISGHGRFVVEEFVGKSRKNRTFINYIKKG